MNNPGSTALPLLALILLALASALVLAAPPSMDGLGFVEGVAEGVAEAHGRSLLVEAEPVQPDPKDASLWRFDVSVGYGDGHPAKGAEVVLSGTGPSGEGLPPLTLAADSSGRYSGTIGFPEAGSWRMHLEVTGVGEGSSDFTHVVPEGTATGGHPHDPADSDPPSAAGDGAEADPAVETAAATTSATVITSATAATSAPPSAPEEQRMAVTLTLTPRDWVNMASRVLHVLGGVVWIGGLFFFIVILRPLLKRQTSSPPAALAEAYETFGGMAALSVALLTTTGVYNLFFNMPNSVPGAPAGIQNISSLLALPLGRSYLVILVVKLVLVAVMVGIAGWMRTKMLPGLAAVARSPLASEEQKDMAWKVAADMTRLTRLNLVLGTVVFILAVLLTSLHLIGHAAIGGIR